jgi:hypothetical protein
MITGQCNCQNSGIKIHVSAIITLKEKNSNFCKKRWIVNGSRKVKMSRGYASLKCFFCKPRKVVHGSYRMKQGKKHQTHIESCNFSRFVPAFWSRPTTQDMEKGCSPNWLSPLFLYLHKALIPSYYICLLLY